jgi:hypothetical protein
MKKKKKKKKLAGIGGLPFSSIKAQHAVFPSVAMKRLMQHTMSAHSNCA